MVLIESSGRELSNGCHIVKFDYLDLCFENLAQKPDLAICWSLSDPVSNQYDLQIVVESG